MWRGRFDTLQKPDDAIFTSPSASLQDTGVSHKGASAHVWCPALYSHCPKMPLDQLALVASGASVPPSYGTITEKLFISYPSPHQGTARKHPSHSLPLKQRAQLPISLHLGADTDRCRHTINHWEPLRAKNAASATSTVPRLWKEPICPSTEE